MNGMNEILNLTDLLGFEWDKANLYKNEDKHKVSFWECEEIFFNSPLLLYDDIKHSHSEKRFYALGKTHAQRKLLIVFTVRNSLIRVISAREMSKRERKIYEKT
jgi:uncharacterized protein